MSKLHRLRFSLQTIACLAVSPLVVTGTNASPPQANFFVVSDGYNSSPGTEAKPFATLQRARDAIRKLKASGPLTAPVTVMVRGGKYFLEQTLVLSSADSGTRKTPITYTAYPGEEPILSGGQKVSGWEPYKGKILRGKLSDPRVTVTEARLLTFDGAIQRRARWPNFDAEKNPFQGGWMVMEGPAESNSHLAFKYRPETLPRACLSRLGI